MAYTNTDTNNYGFTLSAELSLDFKYICRKLYKIKIYTSQLIQLDFCFSEDK